jgi:hypothetical protein
VHASTEMASTHLILSTLTGEQTQELAPAAKVK